MKIKSLALSGLLGLSMLGFAGTASAVPISSWTNITDNGNQNVGGQLMVDVTSYSATQASFKFTNNIGIASSITDIYFDDKLNALLNLPMLLIESDGVSFSVGANPSNLPGGNTVVFNADFSADSDQGRGGVSGNGINSSLEWLNVVFNLVDGKTVDDVLAELASGELVIGMHVQAIGTLGGSDSYINGQPPGEVPEPASLVLLGVGLLGLAAARRRRRA